MKVTDKGFIAQRSLGHRNAQLQRMLWPLVLVWADILLPTPQHARLQDSVGVFLSPAEIPGGWAGGSP